MIDYKKRPTHPNYFAYDSGNINILLDMKNVVPDSGIE